MSQPLPHPGAASVLRFRDDAIVARLSGVTHRYGSTVALRQVDLVLRAGEVVALLGPNGAGKSSTIHLLLGLLVPSEGHASILGADPRQPMARRAVGAMLQGAALPKTLRVDELVALHAAWHGCDVDATEALARAGIAELARRRCAALSGGQQQRVQLALALIGRPRLLVLDEPTTGMDVHARRAFWATLSEHVAEGSSVLLSTHRIDEAEAVASRVVMLHRGEVVADGPPEQIRARLGGTRLRVRTTLGEELAGWAGVRAVQRESAGLCLHVDDASTVLRRLLQADATAEVLDLSHTRLEQVFTSLTEEAA